MYKRTLSKEKLNVQWRYGQLSSGSNLWIHDQRIERITMDK